MNGLNKSALKTTQWEEFFLQEALELEDKMKTLDVDSLNKSKLRICLEHRILDWNEYAQWYMSQKGCSSLKPNLGHEEISQLAGYAQKAEIEYSTYDFWGSDLIPLLNWDNKLIVIGLQYNEKLLAVGEHIFILSPPEILVSITRKIADQKILSRSAEEIPVDPVEISDALEGLNFNQAAPKISFTLIQPPSAPVSDEPISIVTEPVAAMSTPTPVVSPIVPPQPATPVATVAPAPPVVAVPEAPSSPSVFSSAAKPESVDKIWDFISERHQEYSFEVKKQFDAFLVLKVLNNKTNIFKMDPDLSRQNINPMIFEYNLELDGPFKSIYNSKRADVFSMQQLEIRLNDFKHAYIAPLIRGTHIVGFFVGFKKNALSQQDKNLLAELAVEAAS